MPIGCAFEKLKVIPLDSYFAHIGMILL